MTQTQLATLDEVPPGKMLCVEVEGNNILLANVDGTVYAVDDMCTHEDASLSTGALSGDCIKCPLHGSRFDLKTGEPLEDPAEYALKTYPVQIDGINILVALHEQK